eukprot:8630088-Pyramimonas_sp.AAC.1
MANAKHKEKSALADYSPLASRAFGSPVIHDCQYIRALNTAMVRPLRKICGESRYRRVEHRDCEVREKMMSMPPTDCILQKARLVYLK